MSGLTVNGRELSQATVRLLRPNVTVADAKAACQESRLGCVVFSQDQTHFVAYGRGLALPRLATSIPTSDETIGQTEQDGHLYVSHQGSQGVETVEIPHGTYQYRPVRIEALQDQAWSRAKGMAVSGAITAGSAGVAAIAFRAASRLPTGGGSRTPFIGMFEGAAGGSMLMGSLGAMATAGALVGGGMLLYHAFRHKPTTAPIEVLTTNR